MEIILSRFFLSHSCTAEYENLFIDKKKIFFGDFPQNKTKKNQTIFCGDI